MPVDTAGNDATVDVRLQMSERQVQLLETLSDEGGPFDHPNEALAYIIEEFEGLSIREPLKAE
jgi:hypothetical protein